MTDETDLRETFHHIPREKLIAVKEGERATFHPDLTMLQTADAVYVDIGYHHEVVQALRREAGEQHVIREPLAPANALSEAGKKFLGWLEGGAHLRVYDDATGQIWSDGDPVYGYLTIGVGHVIRDEDFLDEWVTHGITLEGALELLEEDCAWATDEVKKVQAYRIHDGVPLKQHEFDALVCFVFNIGAYGFETSTIRRKLLQPQVYPVADAVSVEFPRWRWTRIRGVKTESAGLIRRREASIALAVHADYHPEWFAGPAA